MGAKWRHTRSSFSIWGRRLKKWGQRSIVRVPLLDTVEAIIFCRWKTQRPLEWPLDPLKWPLDPLKWPLGLLGSKYFLIFLFFCTPWIWRYIRIHGSKIIFKIFWKYKKSILHYYFPIQWQILSWKNSIPWKSSSLATAAHWINFFFFNRRRVWYSSRYIPAHLFLVNLLHHHDHPRCCILLFSFRAPDDACQCAYDHWWWLYYSNYLRNIRLYSIPNNIIIIVFSCY